MPILKKLIFAPFFLISFAGLIYQLTPLFKSYDFIFSLSMDTLIQMVIISCLLGLSAFLFVVFAALANEWKIVLPVIFLAGILPLFFLDRGLATVFLAGILISLVLSYLNLETNLKSYLNFQPNAVFGPTIRQLGTFLIIASCVVYFLSASLMISQKGFQIPDSLIESALKFVPQSNLSVQGFKYDTRLISQLPQISPAQLELLRKNPQLLKQYGLDPKILDNVSPAQSTNPSSVGTNDLIKQTLKDQLQNLIKPYLNFIPAFLAVVLFLTLESFISIINLFISPLLWLTFYILEKSNFIKFTEEQRSVKKMVI